MGLAFGADTTKKSRDLSKPNLLPTTPDFSPVASVEIAASLGNTSGTLSRPFHSRTTAETPGRWLIHLTGNAMQMQMQMHWPCPAQGHQQRDNNSFAHRAIFFCILPSTERQLQPAKWSDWQEAHRRNEVAYRVETVGKLEKPQGFAAESRRLMRTEI